MSFRKGIMLLPALVRLSALAAAVAALPATPARAAVSEPEGRAEDAFDFMNLLAAHHLHDLDHEQWNIYGQFTWISSFKRPFHAPYTGQHSLLPGAEHSFTATFTLYGGVRLWPGAELYVVPEVISERPLSGLVGLGGAIQNFELQKQGTESPSLYLSRVYLRQTIGLGGDPVKTTSDPMQLGGTVPSQRVVLTFGNFSVLDFFDKNAFAGDLRRQFFNMGFLTYAAYDFAADARGYTWGALAELVVDDWAVRIGRFVPPRDPNQLPLEFAFWRHYGDQIELEHDHRIGDLAGAIRIIGYRNHERIGRFSSAIAAFRADPARNAASCTSFNYGSTDPSAPDLCWARADGDKLGIGVNLEQEVAGDVGVFVRAMYSDGRSEVYSYTSADRSLSMGALARGSAWSRPKDYAGLGVAASWISASHAEYLALGGVDGFIGDGRLNHAPEGVVELFYGLNLVNSVWLSGDYQFVFNPAYNGDRGPVHLFGVRLHAEF